MCPRNEWVECLGVGYTCACMHTSDSTAPPAVKFLGRMRLLRTDKDTRREWLDNDSVRNPFRFAACHWGQLKLLYSEIEFLTLAAESHDLSRCTLVYAGAAPGHSIALLRRLFPNVKFILVDPATFVAKPDSHVRILNGMFTDETASSILSDNQKDGDDRTLLFLSDIRLTVDDTDGFEDAVFEDMLSQQRWLVNLGAAMGMLKFRLPFANARTGPRDMRYDYKTQLRGASKTSRVVLRKGVPSDPNTVERGTMVYLDGEIRLQVYSPPDSAETRLVVRQTASGKYALRAYDYIAYEQTMVHYNTVTRRARFTFPHNTVLARHIAGFDNGSYECACEAWIASEYIRVVVSGTSKQPAKAAGVSNEVARVVYAIHRDMWEYTKRSVVSCKFETPLASAKHKGLERVMSHLLQHSTDTDGLGTIGGLRKALDSMARTCMARTSSQIEEFTLIAGRTPSQTLAHPLILRRVDYLAQITWLRSELAQIQRLHAVYTGVLSNMESRGATRDGRGRGRGRGTWRKRH